MHYSRYAQRPRLLALTAKDIAEMLTTKYPGRKYILCYTGLSGITLSTAIGLQLFTCHGIEPGYIYVRKKGEDCHGDSVEHENCLNVRLRTKTDLYVFVDDFISDGDTMNRLLTICKDKINSKWYTLDTLPHTALSRRNAVIVLGRTSRTEPFKFGRYQIPVIGFNKDLY